MDDFSKRMEMMLYHSEEGDVSVNAYIMDESLWVTQKNMAELFGVGVPAISKHLKKIFEAGELAEEVVVSKMEIPTHHGAIEGKTQNSDVNFYNLDAIISVGYRVNSKKALHFRIWATQVLKETAFETDYFKELLERVRSIRASERRIWQQITDIFAECSIDYIRDSEVAYAFKENGRKLNRGVDSNEVGEKQCNYHILKNLILNTLVVFLTIPVSAISSSGLRRLLLRLQKENRKFLMKNL